MKHFGIDIGGSGVKGAPVDLERGELAAERLRFDTPQPSTPDAVARVVSKIVHHFAHDGTVGCTFPAIVQHGVVKSAANVDDSWIGTDADALFEKVIGRPVHMINDADAAGVAEMRFGAGAGRAGVVVVLTFGTGIGSALFVDGVLVPNTEFGHLELEGHSDIERWASASAREREDLTWARWGKRVNRYLQHIELILSPELIIIGGGASKRFERWSDRLRLDTEVVPAALLNNAGIVGAAAVASEH